MDGELPGGDGVPNPAPLNQTGSVGPQGQAASATVPTSPDVSPESQPAVAPDLAASTQTVSKQVYEQVPEETVGFIQNVLAKSQPASDPNQPLLPLDPVWHPIKAGKKLTVGLTVGVTLATGLVQDSAQDDLAVGGKPVALHGRGRRRPDDPATAGPAADCPFEHVEFVHGINENGESPAAWRERVDACANRDGDEHCQRFQQRCRWLEGAGGILGDIYRAVQSGFGTMRQMVSTGFADLGAKKEEAAKTEYALRQEIAELRQLAQEGFLNFALRVRAEDFLAFAVIMALGNRNAAAQHLKIPHRLFYDQVNAWKKGSRDQQRMFRLVEWRKTTGRKIVVRLDESVQSGEPNEGPENPVTMAAVLESIADSEQKDYPAIFRDLLELLQRQNQQNWAAVSREAIGIIKEEIG